MKQGFIQIVVNGVEPMRFPKIPVLIFGLYVLIAIPVLPAQGGVLTALNALSMGESTTSAIGILAISEPTATKQMLSFSGQIGDTGWSNHITGTLNGDALDITISGTLSGNIGEDIFVSFSGSGTWGTDPILISSGLSHYFYSNVLGDYYASDFQQLTKIGSASLFGWSVGLEWVGGATLGAIAGAVACSPGVVTAVGGGVIGGIAGGESAAAFSERLWKLSSVQTSAPSTAGLARPLPIPGETISGRGGNYEVTAFDFGDNRLHSASGPISTWAQVQPDLSFSGAICTVPEPSSLAIFATGVVSMIFKRARRRKLCFGATHAV